MTADPAEVSGYFAIRTHVRREPKPAPEVPSSVQNRRICVGGRATMTPRAVNLWEGRNYAMSSTIKPPAALTAPRPADTAQKAVGQPPVNPQTPTPKGPAVVNKAAESTKPSSANPA
jgi:hypothetical protein